MAIFVRQDVWSVESESDPWDPLSLAYARSVSVMQSRPTDDPTSWSYQAAIHGTYQTLIAGATWNQCQHSSWFFLPWHRMYLYWFERIVRSIVLSSGGPADWALPYWNYGRDDNARALPPAFRTATLPDGSPNPLLVVNRAPGFNTGAKLSAGIVSADIALGLLNFSPAPLPGFGGGVSAPTQFDTYAGQLENIPHNIVHSQIGGLMGDPHTAAQDPIFWLHHANIDRIWNQWIGLGTGRANPTDTAWLNPTFTLYNESGASVTNRASDVLNTVSQLCYRYDCDPAPLLRRPAPALVKQPRRPLPPELVAASDNAIQLAGRQTTAEIALPRVAQQAVQRAAESVDAGHLYLNLEGLDVDGRHNVVYSVYFGPADVIDNAEVPSDYLVGYVSFFGAQHHRDRQARADGPQGLTHTFDVTGVVRHLVANNRWNNETLSVTFTPLEIEQPPGQPALERPDAGTAPGTIGRISVTRE